MIFQPRTKIKQVTLIADGQWENSIVKSSLKVSAATPNLTIVTNQQTWTHS